MGVTSTTNQFKVILDVIMLAAEGQGKARRTKAGTGSYQTPILSTSNVSFVAIGCAENSL
jgi:hypothetical protein